MSLQLLISDVVGWNENGFLSGWGGGGPKNCGVPTYKNQTLPNFNAGILNQGGKGIRHWRLLEFIDNVGSLLILSFCRRLR